MSLLPLAATVMGKSGSASIEMHRQIASIINKYHGGRGEITILYPKGCLGNLLPIRTMLSDFTKIDLKLKEASLDEIASEIAIDGKMGRRNFDIALPPTFSIPNLVKQDLILDLSPYAKQWEPKEFRDSHLFANGDYYLDRLYGYQTDGDVYMLFLKKSWLESSENQEKYQAEFGRDLAVPKTWEELDRQIQFFHKPEGNKFGGSLFRNRNYLIWEFWLRLHGKGILPFDDDFQPNISHPQAVEALHDLIQATKYLEPEATSNDLFSNFKSFAQGNKYCNLGWGGTQKFLHGPDSQIKDDLIFAAPPGGIFQDTEFTVPYFNWGWNFCVSNTTSKPELSYLVSLFANTPLVSQKSVAEATGYFDPFRSEHYSDAQISESYGSEFLEVHQYNMENAIPDLYIEGQNQYLGILKQALHATSLFQITPEIALDAVQMKWNTLTKKLGREHQTKQWRALKKTYPEIFLKMTGS